MLFAVHFLSAGGPLLVAAGSLFAVGFTLLVVLAIAGVALFVGEPVRSPGPKATGRVAQGIALCLVVLPALLSMAAAIEIHGTLLDAAPAAPPDERASLLAAGAAGVLNASALLAWLLIVAAPLAAMTVAVWGPIRQRYVDAHDARRLEREAGFRP